MPELVTLVEGGTIPFVNYPVATYKNENFTINPATDFFVQVHAVNSDVVVTLPTLASLAGNPTQIIYLLTTATGLYDVRIETQGADTFIPGHTYVNLEKGQRFYGITMHENGFGFMDDIPIEGTWFLDTDWDATNWSTPTAIPWEAEVKNSQDEILEWDDVNHRFYFRATGEYTVHGGGTIESTGGSPAGWTASMILYKNGSPLSHSELAAGGERYSKHTIFGYAHFDFNENDYLEWRIEHSNLTGSLISASINLYTRI